MERATILIERFGRFLRSARHELGLTQKQLAERCGLAAKHVQTMEVGTTDPSLSTLDAVARGLRVGLDQIVAEILESTTSSDRPTLDLRQLLLIQEAITLLHPHIDQLVAYSRARAGDTRQGGYRDRPRDHKQA